jgi:hypothetical protein
MDVIRNGVWTKLLLILCFMAAPASAWLTVGHHKVAVAAETLLPDDMPEFFRAGAEVIGHVAEDPDYWKNSGTPALRAIESPEHFLDVEELHGKPLPPQRYAFLTSLIRQGLDPARVGMLPYAILEGTQKLTVAFAEYRCWPHDPIIREKILVYAGRLAHYAADLEQPLHTTVDYDGRAGAGGASPHTGIHFRVDALIGDVPLTRHEALGACTAPVLEGDLLGAIMTQFDTSHQLVDRVYELVPPPASVPNSQWHPADSPAVKEFVEDRYCAATGFVAAVFERAWRDSAQIELPEWQREGKTRTFACHP